MMGSPSPLRDVVLLYADKDAQLRDNLLQHLKSLTGLAVWHRGLIQAGSELVAARRNAEQADLVLALISQDLLADDGLSAHLDLAINRHNDGKSYLVPIIISPVTLGEHSLTGVKMVPDKPLSMYSSLDEGMVKVAEQVRAIHKSRPFPQPPALPRSFQPGADAQLTVSLLSGPAGPLVRYAIPRLGHFRQADGDPAALRDARSGDPAALFRVLFPNDDLWKEILRKVYGNSVPHPDRHALRVRIHADTPDLAALPFHRAACGGQPLNLWTFESTRHESPQGARDLATPCPLLLVLSAPAGSDGAHLAALRERLGGISPRQIDADHLHLSNTPAALRSAPATRLLYLLGDADPAWSAALTTYCHATAELHAVYLNGDGWAPLAHQLAERLPLVILGDGDPHAALVFLGAWLSPAGDPVTAARTVRRAGHPPPIVYTAYETAITRAVPLLRPPSHAHLRCDRDTQRALVDKHVSELLASKTRRVEALMAYAAPRNRLTEFWKQALDYLDGRSVRYHVEKLQLPARRGPLLRQGLPEELRQQLGALPGEATPTLLRRKAGPGARLLWLDWGCHQAKALAPPDLRHLLEFSQAELCRDCPADLRIVSYVALELPDDQHGRLLKFGDTWEQDLFDDRFRCTLLPPLGRVRRRDLLNFLSDPANCTCPSSKVEQAARLIDETAGGDYQHTTELIERAELITWSELIREISPNPGGDGNLPETWG